VQPQTRPAAVAGSWYPGTEAGLSAAVDRHLAATTRDLVGSLTALIVPHAGLMYSGPVAAHAYRLLRGRAFDVAVMVGPSHGVAFDGVALWPGGGFETPLGVVAIDAACAAQVMQATTLVYARPAAHAREHSLEMQLPFLQRLAPGMPIVPLLMGDQTAETARELSEALATVLRGRRALLVASTDLSHHHDRPTAAALDAVVVECVSRFDADGLQCALDARPGHACGGGPVVAVMRAARSLGARDALVLHYADSGDVSGETSSVVGYLAAALGTFSQPSGATARA
jgi:AmmeMemoRadiSam system protein B